MRETVRVIYKSIGYICSGHQILNTSQELASLIVFFYLLNKHLQKEIHSFYSISQNIYPHFYVDSEKRSMLREGFVYQDQGQPFVRCSLRRTFSWLPTIQCLNNTKYYIYCIKSPHINAILYSNNNDTMCRRTVIIILFVLCTYSNDASNNNGTSLTHIRRHVQAILLGCSLMQRELLQIFQPQTKPPEYIDYTREVIQ